MCSSENRQDETIDTENDIQIKEERAKWKNMVSERGMTSGTILYDSYVIHDVLGEGGFGITYRATRQVTGEIVAVKEYFPIHLAVRQNDSCNIAVSQQELPEYIHGKERFIKEASILKEYQYLQGIVKVWDCFEANNTAYIIMEYIDGITLKEYIRGHGRMEYSELMEMLSPVLKSLIALHRHGVIHRDISPDNLMIGLDNGLYLIDFGAAKAMEHGKTTTVLLKAGYAPPEQYLHDGDLGAWTDVYAICATIYTALCGRVPADAVARLQGKELISLSEYGVVLESWQWDAIAKGMRMRAAERFRNVEQMYDALTIEPSHEDMKTIAGQELEPLFQQRIQQFSEKEQMTVSSERKRKARFGGIVAALFFAVVIVVYGGSLLTDQGAAGQQNGKNRIENASDEMQDNMVQANVNNQSGQEGEAQEKNGASMSQAEDSSEEIQAKLCSMPNVVGLTEDEAIRKINASDKGVMVRVTRIYSDEAERDVVMEQSVKPDTQYNEGAIQEIMLTVSDGVAPAVKPSSTKQTTEDAYFDIESEEDGMVEFYLD